MSCPKCGSGMPLSGPRYSETYLSGYPEECLIYTCITCGYREQTRTKDQEKQDNLIKALKERKDGK